MIPISFQLNHTLIWSPQRLVMLVFKHFIPVMAVMHMLLLEPLLLLRTEDIRYSRQT